MASARVALAGAGSPLVTRLRGPQTPHQSGHSPLSYRPWAAGPLASTRGHEEPWPPTDRESDSPQRPSLTRQSPMCLRGVTKAGHGDPACRSPASTSLHSIWLSTFEPLLPSPASPSPWALLLRVPSPLFPSPSLLSLCLLPLIPRDSRSPPLSAPALQSCTRKPALHQCF